MNNSSPSYVFNCSDNPLYMSILQAIVVVFQLFQGAMSIWSKYEQAQLHKKVETNTRHILDHSKDILQHKETLNQIKGIITSVGMEVNELNSNQKKSMEIFAQIPEQQSNGSSGQNTYLKNIDLSGQYGNLLVKELNNLNNQHQSDSSVGESNEIKSLTKTPNRRAQIPSN